MSGVAVATAVGEPVAEADLVSRLRRRDLGLEVVRRCVDLPDLLAVAAAGVAEVVIVSADLRRLDREALARLRACGVAVVGAHDPTDEGTERRLRQLGIEHLVPLDADAEALAERIHRAAAAPPVARGSAYGGSPTWPDDVAPARPGPAGQAPVGPPVAVPLPADARPIDVRPIDARPVDGDAADRPHAGPPSDAAPSDAPSVPPADVAAAGEGAYAGRLIAVWGPTGAPGRTTLAVSLAAELAAAGAATLLVDADVYGGTVAQTLGLLEEAPGLAGACRAANAGELDVPRLIGYARDLGGGLRLLTGPSRAERWPELRPASVDVVLELSRRLAAVTVVDCGFCLEQDEELSYDTLAPRRNGATLAVLEAADLVLVVGSADPVGLQRLVRGLTELREAVPSAVARVVLNRVRGSAGAGDAAEVLVAHTGEAPAARIPFDASALDRAVITGRPLAQAAPASEARAAIAGLATQLLGGRPARARRWGRRRRRRAIPVGVG